jgi:hypothetical protein
VEAVEPLIARCNSALPTPPQPIPIQRWTLRRVGLLAAMVLLVVLVFNQGMLSIDDQEAAETPTSVGNLACTDLEPQWLLAQSVPSASLVPCLRSLPAGWMVGNVTVNDGRSVIPLNHDRAGTGVLVIRLTAGCDLRGPPRSAPTRCDATSGSSAKRRVSRPPASTCSRRLCHRPGSRAGGKPGRGRQPAGHDRGLHHPAGAPAGAGPALGWATAARPTHSSTTRTTRVELLDSPRRSTAATSAGCSDLVDQVDGADQLKS